ncbi:MAG: 4Fe-4S binding protein [Candidatus Bathyarchaeia archaeon]
MRLRKKAIRYLRWAAKAIFLFLFAVPLSYILEGQMVEVKSFIFTETIATVPITQSPDSIWLSYYGNVNPGLWILEPLGGLQVLLTGQVETNLLIPTVIATLMFVAIIILLGNVFCSWACPIGTLIDSFDMVVGKVFPKIEAKREKRRLQAKKGEEKKKQTRGSCLICPLHIGLLGKNEVLAKGITISALVATIFLRYPAFCAVCPIGIVSRGMIHLKSIKSALAIKGTQLILWLEMFTIPVLALFLSLKERRYWCRHLCPVGVFLGAIGTLNPFLKPRVKENKCIMYGCPENCKDYSMDYCAICRLSDAKKCEKVCPVDINLIDHGSLARCTKCLECYLICDHDAIAIDFLGRPEAFRSITHFYDKLRRF